MIYNIGNCMTNDTEIKLLRARETEIKKMSSDDIKKMLEEL